MDFNGKLINEIKMFFNDQNAEEVGELKYAFMLYLYEQIEGISIDAVTVCNEEFPGFRVNVDGYHYDEDSNVYNLIITIFNEDNNDDSKLSKNDYKKEVDKVVQLIKMVQDGQYTKLQESSLMYDICQDIKSNIKECEVVITIYSNYIIPTDIQKDDVEDINGIRVSFNTYDLLDLKDKFSQLNRDVARLNFREKYGESIRAIKISSTVDFDVYMCSIKGLWLAKLYKEDGQRLLEPNVRSYLKRTSKTNAGILETVKTYPEQFVSYNNGLSSIATGAEIIINSNVNEWCIINSLDNFQIVNGGQTTATLAECMKDKLLDELNDVVVPMKLTIIKNVINSQMLINNISVFSNTQTAIKKSDPPSNLQYYIDLKNISNNVVLTNEKGKNYVCYFERTAGEFETELKRNNSTVSFQTKNPKDKKFSKIQLAICINCWQQMPHIVNQGREKNFTYFNNIVKNQIIELDEKYFKEAYATIILFRNIDKLCKKLKLSFKSNVVTYTLSLLSYLSAKTIDLQRIFNNQSIDENLKNIIIDLLPRVHKIVSDAPSSCPEVRMWARKEALWLKLKNQISLNYNFEYTGELVDFFPENEAQLFIESSEHFKDILLWQRLLTWNDKKKILNKSQVSMVKGVIAALSYDKTLTKGQINYAKDIFMAAAKARFEFKK